MQKIFKKNIQMKPEAFFLGLMDRLLEKEPWNFVSIYGNGSKAPLCTELDIYENAHSGRMVVKVVGICRGGQTYLFDWRKYTAYMYC